MNWLTDFVRPKIKKVTPKEIADNLWVKCPICGQMLFSKEMKKSLYVCTSCGHHLRLYVDKRLKMLFDGEFNEIALPKVKEDPLKFKDTKRYTDRLKAYRKSTESNDAIRVAQGDIGGIPCVVAAMDFSFMGGSMGMAVGEGIVKAAEVSARNNYPLIIVASSGGARMQEGIFSLMQMAKTSAAIQRFSAKGGLYISVLTHPTTGGVTASFASLGDIMLAEPGALIGFAGPRVIEQTIGEKLPAGFQRSEFQMEHGFVDQVVPRSQLRDTLIQVLQLHAGGKHE